MTTDPSPAATLADLWERHRGTNLSRVAVLEDVTLAIIEGTADDEARSLAQREAHKLAGSLGTFGFHEGSRLARSIESLLEDERPEPLTLADAVALLAQQLDPSPGPVGEGVDPAPPVSDGSGQDVETSGATPAFDGRRRVVVLSADEILIGRLADAAKRVELTVTDSAETARSLVETGGIDTVLVDLDGDHGMERFEAIVPTSSSTRFFALTGSDDPDHRLRVAQAGGHGYFPRTFAASRLFDPTEAGLTSERYPGARILAVDDDPTQLDVLDVILGGAGMTVTPLTEPLRFWETLQEVRPDAVIVDVDMPGVSGLVLCRMVRNDPRWHRLPVLVLTAGHDATAIQSAFAAGADDYIAKPIASPQFEARVASHVERHRLVSRLTDVDPLCGIWGRRSAEQSLGDLVRLAGRQASPLSLAMVDLDHFRRVNSRGGHLTGDAVLRTVADLMRRRVREEDVVGRWGGDEFVLGFYGLSSAVAVERLTDMLGEMSSSRFADLDGRDFGATFSAGVAEFPRDGTDLPALIGAADAALYRAKAVRATVRAASSLGAADQGTERVDVVVVDDDATSSIC